MNIPNEFKLKIGGLIYEVRQVLGLADSGNQDDSNLVILLNKGLKQEQKESTLLHEIIEAINSANDLGLTHQTIQTLEASLYQVLKDNDFI